jgi:hypothetical protein
VLFSYTAIKRLAKASQPATQLAYRRSLASYMLALEQLKEAVGVRSLP